jgi:NADH:ubiquinone oxidoreductase subunit 3 (subunit A)
MLYDYIATLFFAAFGIAIPAMFLAISRFIRKEGARSKTKDLPYESGERSTGTSMDIDNEYLPYLMSFMPLEIIALIVILWAVTARALTYEQNLLFIGIAIMATAFVFIAYRFINDKHAQRQRNAAVHS